MRTYCIAQGTLLNGLWWPRWKENLKQRGWICMYKYSLCYTGETNTTLQSNSTPIKILKKANSVKHVTACGPSISHKLLTGSWAKTKFLSGLRNLNDRWLSNKAQVVLLKKSHLLAYLCRIKMWIRPALEEKLVKKKYLVMSPSLIQHFIGSVPCDRHPIDRHTPKTRPCPQRTRAQMPLMTKYEDQVQTLAKSLASSSFPTFLSWASFTKWLNTISPPNSCHCVLDFPAGN